MAVLTLDFLIEASPEPSVTVARNWVAAAARAHAILSQTLPDDLLDTIGAGLVGDRTALSLPPVLAG
jgi:hypothetical protein